MDDVLNHVDSSIHDGLLQRGDCILLHNSALVSLLLDACLVAAELSRWQTCLELFKLVSINLPRMIWSEWNTPFRQSPQANGL